MQPRRLRYQFEIPEYRGKARRADRDKNLIIFLALKGRHIILI